MKIGVLRNPLSTKNLTNPHWNLPGGFHLVEVGASRTIADAVAELAREKLDLLLIDGGDGTVTATISAFFSAGTSPPPLGIIANGNTNLIARKAGKLLTQRDLPRLVEMPVEDLSDLLRPMSVLGFEIMGRETRYGFIAGWGAYARGTQMATEEMQSKRDLQVMATILAVLRRSLFGAEARALRKGVNCRFEVDGLESAPKLDRFVGVVTSLDGRLAAGVKPFWGRGHGPVRWLDVTAPPRFHVLLTPFVLFGLALPMFSRLGYRSGRATRVSVTLSDEMIIDGEVVSLPPETQVDIDAKHQLDVLQL